MVHAVRELTRLNSHTLRQNETPENRITLCKQTTAGLESGIFNVCGKWASASLRLKTIEGVQPRVVLLWRMRVAGGRQTTIASGAGMDSTASVSALGGGGGLPSREHTDTAGHVVADQLVHLRGDVVGVALHGADDGGRPAPVRHLLRAWRGQTEQICFV